MAEIARSVRKSVQRAHAKQETATERVRLRRELDNLIVAVAVRGPQSVAAPADRIKMLRQKVDNRIQVACDPQKGSLAAALEIESARPLVGNGRLTEGLVAGARFPTFRHIADLA